MSELHKHILLLFSIPIYAILIPLEIVLSNFHDWKFYSWRETLMNIYLNLVNVGVDLLLRGLALVVLIYTSQYALPIHWSPFAYWFALLIFEDIFFWLEHYVDHNCRFFWAMHITHHSSQEFNLSTGFRSSVFMPFYRYMYFVPLALLGFQPLDILFMYALTQTYGILVHTQAIKKLPAWIEFIFVTPSHHRVHHARNIDYLDKNMGMVLIIWDRMFGTFVEEMEHNKPRYGINKKIDKPYHPVTIIFHEWKEIAKDLQKSSSWKDKLCYLFKAPGWSHDGSTQTAKKLQERKNKRSNNPEEEGYYKHELTA
jgi:sterol desaturase/sphingolipid hydroxylase (fatty acid hydroxylase superfamily)